MVLTSQFLGAEGKGWYSWWILNISFTMLLSNFIGGSAIVYFASRFKLSSLLLPSYLWGSISAVVVSLFLLSIQKLDADFLIHFMVLSMIETFISIHLFIFQGRNKISPFNWLPFISLLLFSLYFGIHSFVFKSGIEVVLQAFYFSKVVVLILSIGYLIKLNASDTIVKKVSVKELFQFGLVLQMANIAQFLNYRFSFYLLEEIDPSLFFLGVFSTAISVAEGIWILSKSISAVHYAEVSNSRRPEKSIQTTLQLFRLTSIIVLLGIGVLLLIPSHIYTFLLGADFKEVKYLLVLLSPGIFIFSLSGIISHFFSGIGNNTYALLASATGLLCTILLGYSLIPNYQMRGAALVNSISYGISTLMLIFIFKKKYHLRLSSFFIKKSDISLLYLQTKEQIKQFWPK